MALLKHVFFGLFLSALITTSAQEFPAYYIFHRSGKIERVNLISFNDSFFKVSIDGRAVDYSLNEIDSITRTVPKFSKNRISEIIKANPFLDSFSSMGYFASVSRGYMLSGIETNINYGLNYQARRNRRNTIGLNIEFSFFTRRQLLLVPICFESRYYSFSPKPMEPFIAGFRMGYAFNMYSSNIVYDGGPTAAVFGGKAFLIGKNNYLNAFFGIKGVIAGSEMYNIPNIEKVRSVWLSPELHAEFRF